MAIRSKAFDLTERVALVTGGASGLGKAAAQALVEHGAKVLIGSRTKEKVDQAVTDLRRATEADEADPAEPTIDGVSLDVTSDDSVDAAVKHCMDEFGRLDILVNNAGGTLPVPAVEDVPELLAKVQGAPRADDDFTRTALFHASAVQNNLTSPLWFSLRAARQMLTQDGCASIVNISSGASHAAGSPTLVSYGAAKAGLNHMTKSLAQEWGPRIRVNCLALGPTMTDNFRAFVLGEEGAEEKYFENVPIRRAGEPTEVGEVVVFLCSGRVDVINGATIEMDGGMLPGVLYEPGLEPIRKLLDSAGKSAAGEKD